MQQTKNETKQEQPLEFTKIQGFDVLDKLPEETKLKSYNEEFFNTLNNLKFLSCSIPDDDKLFYHFEQNENASLTSTIGQMEVTVKELSGINIEVKGYLEIIQSHVDTLRKRVEVKNFKLDYPVFYNWSTMQVMRLFNCFQKISRTIFV